jgi:chromosome segregation ATPase
MTGILIIVIAVIEAAALSGYFYKHFSKNASSAQEVLVQLDQYAEERKGLKVEAEGLLAEMVPMDTITNVGREFNELVESLKAERGRNTITQAELETVETRLRELEEIERELEASGIETKEELKILSKKQKDLSQKNDALKSQIQASLAQVDQIMKEMESNAELIGQVDIMKTQLIMTQEKIDTLLLQIEQGNDQYFVLKNRYDALDIEYAQLFEKFSEAEAQMAPKKT